MAAAAFPVFRSNHPASRSFWQVPKRRIQAPGQANLRFAAVPIILRGIPGLCLAMEFLMLIKFTPETLKLVIVSFCTFVCSSTAIIVAVTPFGSF
jgi:hypothetical protein